jgi:hypothetical protein
MIKNLIVLANELDKRGLTKEASHIDYIINKLAAAERPLDLLEMEEKREYPPYKGREDIMEQGSGRLVGLYKGMEEAMDRMPSEPMDILIKERVLKNPKVYVDQDTYGFIFDFNEEQLREFFHQSLLGDIKLFVVQNRGDVFDTEQVMSAVKLFIERANALSVHTPGMSILKTLAEEAENALSWNDNL